MSEIARLYKYKSLLSGRRVLTAGQLTDQLEISQATLKRDLAKLRDQFQLPIRFDRDRGGYYLDHDGKTHELPGLWLQREELASLIPIQHLAAQLQPGMVSGKLDALGAPLAALLRKHGLESEMGARKTRILPSQKRRCSSAALDAINQAVATHKRLRLSHYNRERDEVLVRDVSPQRLLLYRDNWYLVAWCHLREAFRIFAADAVREAQVLQEEAIDLDPVKLDEALHASYGIFAGRPRAWAVLRFTAKRARWVSDEIWHPRQITRILEDGSLELKVPFSDDRELVGDILRFGADVLVIAPLLLRKKIQRLLLEAATRYVEALP